MISTHQGLDLFIFLAILAVTVFVYVRNSNLKRSALPYPPGPRKLPLLGNALDIPARFEWETYARWAKEYKSDIIHLTAAGNNIVVLNSYKAAVDLLEKRSSTYSSRPHLTMASELMGWKCFMFIMPYGEKWRESRRAFTQYFQGGDSTRFHASHTEFVSKMLPRLLDRPEEFYNITRRTVGEMALSLAYGIPTHPTNDPFIDLVERSVASVLKATAPGAFLVDIFPVLKYVPEFIPGAGFQKKAREWRELQGKMREATYQETVRTMASGIFKPSFTSTSLQNLHESADLSHQKEVIRDTAANVFIAGAETTDATIHTFFVAMLSFPEVQQKAQAELDRVLRGRLPEFSDEADLPYLSALVKEVLRWKPVTPIAVPHCVTADDVYEGYYIPKGSIIIPNVWAMFYNEAEYPNPSSFEPDRFMKDGKLDPTVPDPSLMAFGFGRRICPGNQIAASFLWLTIASVLTTLDISKALGSDGNPIEQEIEYQSSLSYNPLPFRCTLKPRSEAAERVIRSAGDSY
ncbi:hypothetical protein GALMADRAFT_104206 [Galerina marginata CBS 339.88]|uniref:Cytochrome P450 n=1 Tax=Galerina marginata (strain CBS 339.88) TaxID=685588 RepID=A0A067SEB8_GALM3|nr:hypothetical protein GALMADRAFT_104206 [Galerina marginata CBS 339.88]